MTLPRATKVADHSKHPKGQFCGRQITKQRKASHKQLEKPRTSTDGRQAEGAAQRL